jgi:hypothetical protein
MVIQELANGKLWTKHYIYSGGFLIFLLSKGETKTESSPPTFRLRFLLVTPLARERRRSLGFRYLGVRFKTSLSAEYSSQLFESV